MEKCRKIIFMLATVVFFFFGCTRGGEDPTVPRLVTQIEVVYSHGEQLLRRQYTDPSKMSSVLNYIRLLDRGGPADTDPERVPGDACKITLRLSDGSSRVYHQRSDRFLSKDFHSWQRIDPEQGQQLLPLLEGLESDKV